MTRKTKTLFGLTAAGLDLLTGDRGLPIVSAVRGADS